MRPQSFFPLPLLVCWLFAGSAEAQTLSASKLSAHLINGYTAGGSNIIAGHPRVLKVLGLDSGFPSGMVQAMRDYKTAVPGGKLIVRIYSAKTYSLNNDATASAGDFWTNILQQGLNYLAPSDRALIDYLEGPNEGQTPTLGYPNTTAQQALQASEWFNQFWTNLTPRIVAAGYRPCIGSIAVGNPGGTLAQMQSYLAAFVPALRQAKAASGAWSYHAYTINYTTDPNDEFYYSLRYRQFYSYFATAFPDLKDMPLLLTEGGVDQSGNPSTSGWQARGPAANYERWLNWFDRQMQQDPYVVGCTLFEIGNPESWGWPSFDLEPIAGWMRNYLIDPTNLPAPPNPVSAAATPGGILLSWTNVPVNPTTWNVKRATSSLGPFATIGPGITAGVPATTYTDTAVSTSTTYYYIVTASNLFGESGNSAVVSARPTNALPDVVVTAATWSPPTLFAGTHVVFSARVLNQGSGPTPSGTTLGVGFNVDGAGTASWSGSYTTALAPGNSVTLTADGGPTGNYWTATPGAHTVVATVDDVNRFPESNENNNALSVPLLVYATGYALNSGGPAVGAFAADANFTGSANTLAVTNVIDTAAASNPAPIAVYQTERWGEFAYLLNNLAPGSNYTVRLHFAEISPVVNNPGDRRFNVSVNGVQVLTDLDVLTAAGAKFRAWTVDIKKRADASGTLLVQFTRGAAYEPECNGVQVFGSPPPPAQAPVVTNVALTPSALSFGWSAFPAAIYQVQYKNDLTETNWTVLNTLVATGSMLTITNDLASPRQFFRVVQMN